MNAHFLAELFPTCPIYRLATPNARAAQDLPMGRAKSFPMSFGVLFSRSLHNDRPITPVEQGGNYGGNWMLGRNCFPGYLLITDEGGCL